MSRKILHKRGLKANLPKLDEAEFALTTDDKKVHIGTKDGNMILMDQNDKQDISRQLAENVKFVNDLNANVKKFGAKGDGVTDDTQAIQRAIDSLTTGGILFFPVGNYLVSGNSNSIFRLTKPIKVKGTGLYSKIVVAPSTSAVTDVIEIYPDVNYGGEGYGLEAITIEPKNLDNGLAIGGRHNVYIRFDKANQFLYRLVIEKCVFRNLKGNGVRFENINAISYTSMGQCTIQYNIIQNGIHLENSGDSNNILFNGISRGNIGIYMKSLPGSTENVIMGNNIVSKGGAMKIALSNQVKILYNQCEQTDPITTSETAMLTIGDDDLPPSYLIEVKGNNFNTHSNVEKNIFVRNSTRVQISENRMRNKDADKFIVLSNTVKKADLKPNNMFEKTGGGTKTSDSAVTNNAEGTANVLHTPTLLNNATVSPAFNAAPQFYKTSEETVHLSGIVQWTATPGTATKIFDLPVYFRPEKAYRFPVFTDTGYGVCAIDSSGGVYYMSGGSGAFSLSGISFKALVES